MATTTLHPVGDGTYTEWDTAFPGGGDHYAKVDDDPHDSETTYLASANGFGIAGNITPFLRLSSTDEFGSKQALTDDYTVYTQEIDRPGGGSWSKSDLDSVEMGIRTNVGIGVDDDDSFTTDSSSAGEVSTIPDEHAIEKVEVRFVGKRVGTKTQTSYCTAVRLIVTHDVAAHPAPTDIEIDHQASPATNVSEAPKITAVFNGLNSSDVAADVYVQVSEDDSFSSAGLIYDSDWLSLSSPGCAQGERCEGIIYGAELSAPPILSSHPPDDKYYVRIKFRDDSSAAVESDWSDTVSGEPSEFSGINRDWALPAYAARCKLYVDTDHSYAIDAGADLPFSFKTGERIVAGVDGCFNEAVQNSGGFQIAGYGSKLFYVYLSIQDPTDANYAIHIRESSDGGETWSAPVNIRSTGTYFDTHYFPTLVIDKLGYIHVTCGAHGGPFYYTHSTNPADISSWETPTTITGYSGTYPVGILVPTKGGVHGRVYWFWRNATSYKNSFIYSDDGGSTWSSVHDFIVDTDAATFRVYCYGYRYDLNAQRLHVAYTHNHTGDVEMGIWYIYCDLDEVDSLSGDYGFNVWHWVDDDVAGYSTGATGDAVDYTVAKAIVFGEDHLARTFIECLELDADGNPIVFWEQKITPGDEPTDETYLVCATWNGSSWDTHHISDQVNRMLRVRRSSIGLGRDKDSIVRAIMPVAPNTWWHFNPTADLDSVDITRKSEASNYLEVDEGPTDCDKDGSYFDVGTSSAGAQASFSSNIDMIDGTREIFTLEIRAIIKQFAGSTSCYLYVDNGSNEYDSSSITINNSTYEEVSATWDINPFTSLAWTESDLDSLQFGIKQVGDKEIRVTRIFARARYTLQSDAEWLASEIFELTSSDNGATWQVSRELSRNSGTGVPMMNNAHYLFNNRIHVIWTSGFDLFYFTDKRFGLVQFTGNDLRVYHAGVEIDRVLDYANKNETEIRFQCQEEIPANRRAGPDDYYVYFGNPNEATAAKSDPHGVWGREFQNWEAFEHNDDLDGEDGWAVSGGTALAYTSPPYHAQKVGAGEVSAKLYPSDSDLTFVKTIGSGLTNVQLDILFWMELSGGDNQAWAEFEDSGGGIFGAGLDQDATRAAYKVNSSWTSSSVYAKYKNMNHLRIRITNAGCSAWWNGEEIVLEYNDSDAITSVDKLRLCCNAGSYFDLIRVGYSWATSGSGGVADPEVIVQSEEWRGYRIDATLLGRGSDSFIIDATIWGFKMGSVSAVVDAVDPVVILGTILVSPAATSCDCSAVDPVVILGSITLTASVTTIVAAIAPTIVLGSTTASPGAVATLAAAVDPSVVQGSLLLTPSAATIVAGIGQPTVILGSLTITATASVVVSTDDPEVVLGSTSASPDAVSIIISSVDPQVVHGSLAITPAAVSCVLSAVDPAVLLGSTSATPAATTVVTSVGQPTVVLSSLALSPTASDVIISAVNPGVVIGAVTVSPAAVTAIASVVNPTVTLGSTTASPAAITAIISTVDPVVVLSSISIAPGALSAVIAVADPSVVIGAVTVTPDAVTVVASVLNPTILLGSTTATPSAVAAIASTSAPTVSLGSIAVEPTPASAIATAINPAVVIGALSITPAAVSALVSTADPTVILGSTTAQPTPVSAVVATEDPLVLGGSITLSPTATTVVTDAVDPTVILGAISIQPAAVSCIALTSGPSVILGSVTISPTAVSAIATSTLSAVVLGSLSLSPTAASAICTAVDPTVEVPAGISVSPEAVAIIAGAVDPTTILGSTQVSPTAAVVYTSVGDPVLVLGSLSISPAALDAIAGAVDPTVVFGALVITPTSSQAVAVAVSPSIILGSTVSVPNPVSAIAEVLAPTVIITGVTLVLPDGRTVIVGEDDRMFTVSADDRGVLVQSDDRTSKAPADDRGVLVESEDRTSTISKSN